MDIKDRIGLFKDDLTKHKLSHEEIFQKHIIDIETFFFTSILKDSEKEYMIRSFIAEALDVHLDEVLIVGSAKLGFSLKPGNFFNPFDYLFNQTKKNKDKSDLDIAVISNDLFDYIGKTMFEFTHSYRDKWSFNEYYSTQNIDQFEVPINYKYFEYITKGWFRPDFKPVGFEFCVNNTFESLKQKIQSITQRKPSIGIFQDWYFFKSYHIDNLQYLISKTKTGIL